MKNSDLQYFIPLLSHIHLREPFSNDIQTKSLHNVLPNIEELKQQVYLTWPGG